MTRSRAPALVEPTQANDAPAPRRRGRPRDPARLARILEVAQEQFLEHGLEGTSLDRIAQAADTTRVTIYSYFGSKEALFNATMCEPIREQVVVGIDTLDPAQPRDALLSFATGYLKLILDDKLIAHTRILYASSGRDPALGRAFYVAGPQSVENGLANYLSRAHTLGTLRTPEPAIAAEQFLSMVRGNEQIRVLMGRPAARAAKARRAYLESSVNVFLKAYAV